MTTKKRLILDTLQFANEVRWLSWYYLCSTLILTSIAFLCIAFFTAIILKLFFGLMAGLLTARLLVIYHDFQHGAILEGSWMASIIMKLIGIVTLTPPSIWDESHEHHHHTNAKFSTFVLGSFPTISTTTYHSLTRLQRYKYLLIRHPLMILLGYIPIFLVSFCFWPFFENPKRYWDCGVAAIFHIAIACLLWSIGGWTLLFYSLIIPSMITFSLAGYVFYAQHNFPQVILHSDQDWDYFEAALQSSSFIRMSRIMNWFTANIGYHHIHHVNAMIPFYRLPKAMASIPEFQNPRTTSFHPREVWRCLKLKLWDEQHGKMISLRELEETCRS